METEHVTLNADDPGVEIVVNEVLAAAPAPPPFPVGKVVFGVFAGVAVLMLGLAAATGFATVRTIAREQTAPGRVVGLTPRTVSVEVESGDPARKRYVD